VSFGSYVLDGRMGGWVWVLGFWVLRFHDLTMSGL